MSTASRRTKSLGLVVFLIATMLVLILIYSPPAASVIRSEAVAVGDEEDDSAQNYGVRKSSSSSSAVVGGWLPDDESLQGSNDLLRSNFADSHLGWREGIFATHEDRDRIDNTSPALETYHHVHARNNDRPSVSEGRNLRSRPTRDRTRLRRPRGGRSSQEEHWCECIQNQLMVAVTNFSRSHD